MKIYLHIGTEKTGTTTLQYFFKKNENILNEFGFSFYCNSNKPYYEDSNLSTGHFPLVAAFMQHCPDFVTENKFQHAHSAWNELKTDILKKNKHAIISAEHFSSRLHHISDLTQLRDTLNMFDVNIICYIRRQDELALSTYSTKILSGHRHPFNEEKISTLSPFYNYDLMLKPWISVFGKKNISVIKYDKACLTDQDICRDFLMQIGISEFQSFNFITPKNKSLDASQLQLIRQMNNYLPAYGESNEEHFRNAVSMRMEILPLLANGRPLATLLSDHEREKILRKFYASNKKIERLFMKKNTLSDWLIKSKPFHNPFYAVANAP